MYLTKMLPEIKFIKKNKHCIEFETKNVHVSFLNAIRRIVLTEIPSLAFDKILFEKYSCGMNEDMLAHRISLVPICFSNINLKHPGQCTCVNLGCNKCEIEFDLEVKNQENCIQNVHCSDLVSSSDSVKILSYPDNNNGILLCQLHPKEVIKLKAKAVLGYGKDHEKWSHVTVCYFKKTTYGFLFHLECNENISAIYILKQAFKIFDNKLNSVKSNIKFYRKSENKYCFPYCDTIMNPILQDVLSNYDVDLCYYKRGHFLEKKKSDFYIQSPYEAEPILKETINILLSHLHLVENQLIHY